MDAIPKPDIVMHSCEHTALLQVAGSKEVVLYDFGRLERIIRDLPGPGEQYPRYSTSSISTRAR